MSIKSKRESGQFMVELMVAASLMIICMLGTFSVLSQSLSLSRVAENQYVAAGLAAEGVEVVKNIIDANAISETAAWNEDVSVADEAFGVQFDTTTLGATESGRSGSKLRYDDTTGLYSYDTTGEETNFIRAVNIKNLGDLVQVESKVTWVGRGGADFEIVVIANYLNWRKDL